MTTFFHKELMRFILGVVVMLALFRGHAHAAWLVQRMPDTHGGGEVCVVTSETKTVSDGYQQTRAYITVHPNAVYIQTEATLDTSFSDIGFQVDQQAFIRMDDVSQRYTARFASHYDTIIAQFKQGRKAEVTLHFWPTWPDTGAHAVTFSLMGFSKAYGAARACTDISSVQTAENGVSGVKR